MVRKSSFYLCLLALMFLVLTACQPKVKEYDVASSQTSTTVSSAKRDDKRVARETTLETSATSAISNESQTLTSSPIVTLSPELLYETTLRLVAEDKTEGHATLYGFYDIDHNGTPELLTATSGVNHPFLAAVYYLNQGQPTFLAQAYVKSSGGMRADTVIYTDGTVFETTWHSLRPIAHGKLYRLAGEELTLLSEMDYDMFQDDIDALFDLKGKVRLDISSLTWYSFDTY